ncbi:CIC11C00000003261 [Sungouiella intermedia]|uniref:CIC11C00000003261 n=1 Tax=Sungouiella intermedia TaxID=45354 RepID=A0A1L0GME0_9ASCO|nr:CIC11C00000003261 [[Candida] intermedia]
MAAVAPEISANKSGKQKVKSKQYHVVYDNPELKVVVRLLPPSLNQDQFLEQLIQKGIFSKENSPYTKFYYEPGSRNVKLFEEPVFSRAYFQFPSKQLANNYMNELNNLTFEESDTGDHFMCQTMKSIFGAVGQSLISSESDDFSTIPLYTRYLQVREEKGPAVNLAEVQRELQAEERQKKLAKKQNDKVKEKKKKKKEKLNIEKSKEGKQERETTVADPELKKKKKKRSKKKKTGGQTPDLHNEANGSVTADVGKDTGAVLSAEESHNAGSGFKSKKKNKSKKKAPEAKDNTEQINSPAEGLKKKKKNKPPKEKHDDQKQNGSETQQQQNGSVSMPTNGAETNGQKKKVQKKKKPIKKDKDGGSRENVSTENGQKPKNIENPTKNREKSDAATPAEK